MSQQRPNRYELPLTSMVGAMGLLLVCIFGYVGFRALVRDNEPTPVEAVDYSGWVKAGRQEGALAVLSPTLPKGWKATSAKYTPGTDPHWHLGVLTDGGKYIGLEESLASVDDQVQEFVDPDAKAGAKVTVDGVTWQSWTDGGGDYALTSTRKAPRGKYPETVLVSGSAGADDVKAFVGSLTD